MVCGHNTAMWEEQLPAGAMMHGFAVVRVVVYNGCDLCTAVVLHESVSDTVERSLVLLMW